MDAQQLETAGVVSAAIASVGIVVETGEVLAGWRRVIQKGFTWQLIETRYYVLLRHPRVRDALRALYGSDWALRALVVAHAIAAVLYPIALPRASGVAAVLAATVLAVHLLLHFRYLVGLDGADQMQTIVWSGLLVFALFPSEPIRIAAAAFVVAQVLLAYATAGIAKAVSSTWRSGAAVGRIVRTSSYGAAGAREVLAVPLISFLACWGTILFETTAPVLWIAGGIGLALLMVEGFLFHVGIGLVMGLPAFVWSFLGAYPFLWVLGSEVGLLG
jgi:hypothetical protein